MSQSIRIFSTGLGLKTLQHIPTKKHTCMDVGFPVHSVEECRKGAWLSVSNRNPRPDPFLLYATMKDEGVTGTSKGKDDELIMLTLRILKLLMDYNNPMDGLGIGRETLLEALHVWKMKSFEIDSNCYYLRLPLCRFHPFATSKDEVKYLSSKLTKGVLTIVSLLMHLNDPNDGFTVLNNALEIWNGILLKVQFDLNEEAKVHPFFRWLVLMACKIAFHRLRTPAEFRRLRSQILE